MSTTEQITIRIQVCTEELVSTPNEGVAQDWIQRMSVRQMSILQEEYANDSLCQRRRNRSSRGARH